MRDVTDSPYPDGRPPAPTLDERLGWTIAGIPVVVTETGYSPGAVVVAESLWDGTVSIAPSVNIDPDQAAELFHRVGAGIQEFIDAFRGTGQTMSVTLRPLAEQLERERARAEVAAIEATARLAFRAEGDRCAPLQAVRFDASGLPVDEGPEEW